ncbi:hypothetical protein GP486_007449 [Trichoglossum hirsutum]|uniref:HNH nuclease domain-containing protein n=1 Tax=Trichoglossum hirsutum TaxID=265104 RepID=A0A9P8IBU3_9PEZI|nr:hypothetical protein GP486_007449 [Trichoglossum hirsutum]
MANGINETSITIPERTSSLLSTPYKKKVRELSISSSQLKRKASVVSRRSGTDSIDVQLELSRTNYGIYTTIFQGLKESWEAGMITGDEFKAQGKDIWRKRLRLNKERTALEERRQAIIEQISTGNPRFEAAYSAAIMTNFTIHSGPPPLERRNKHRHADWKDHLRGYYNSVSTSGSTSTSGEPVPKGWVWCPILKTYGEPFTRCAAHIIPHFVGYENVAWILGDEGNTGAGSSHIWSFKNGLVISKILEQKFDRGDFVIVPIPTEIGAPQRLRFVLLNTTYSHHTISESKMHYSELDGTELEFKGDGRPGLRHLYWHYVTSILRSVKWGKTGWDDLKARFPDRPIWATPGPYLRRSMLRQLAIAIGDYEPEELEFQEGVYDGKGLKSEIDEETIAADVAERLGVDDDDDGWSSEDSEEDDYDEE